VLVLLLLGSDHGIFLEKITSWFEIYGYDGMVQWRTQEFFSGEVLQIQLRTDGR
jgi:hypothetical protein